MKLAVKELAADLLEAVACRKDVMISVPYGGNAPYGTIPDEIVQEVIKNLRGDKS